MSSPPPGAGAPDAAAPDVELVLQAVRRQGIAIHLEGLEAVLDLDGNQLRRRWAWLPKNSPSPMLGSVLDAFGPDTLLLADRIPAMRAAQARERGLWYADATGRLYLRAHGLLVDVSPGPGTNLASGKAKDGPRAGGASNLLSPARAQVIFALLAWPELVRAPVRALASISGTSDGGTQGVLAALEDDGYLTLGRQRMLRAPELLQRWAGAFARGLGRKQQLGGFTGTPDARAWSDAPYRVYVSGEAASEDIHGPGLVLYVPRLDPRLVLASRWQGEPGPDAPIVVRRQFWRDPDTERPGHPRPTGLATAPWPLLYADLVTSREPRARAVAAQVAERAWTSYEPVAP